MGLKASFWRRYGAAAPYRSVRLVRIAAPVAPPERGAAPEVGEHLHVCGCGAAFVANTAAPLSCGDCSSGGTSSFRRQYAAGRQRIVLEDDDAFGRANLRA